MVFPGLPRRIAAGGVARWKRRIYVLGGENGSRFYDSVYCWKPGWRSWVQRREKLPGDTGGVSQFGCTTLKFPKKAILSRLRLARDDCKNDDDDDEDDEDDDDDDDEDDDDETGTDQSSWTKK